MKIDLLPRQLAIKEQPELNATDARFDAIATLVQQGEYIEAADLSKNILADEIYDIRLICYFLYGYWLEQGLTSLLTVIDCLHCVVFENWAAIGPVAKREKVVQNSLNWLFKQLLKHLQYQEKKKTPLWQQWQVSIGAGEISAILAASEAFRLSIAQQFEDLSEPVTACSKVENWLQTLQRQLYLPPEVKPAEPEKMLVNSTTVSPILPETAGLKIDVSYPMTLLLKKLAAFEYLLQAHNFSKAALLADDINQALEDFDPMVYFPKIFETFAKLKVLNFEELSVYDDYRGSAQWQAMQDWLKIDVDSFVKE